MGSTYSTGLQLVRGPIGGSGVGSSSAGSGVSGPASRSSLKTGSLYSVTPASGSIAMVLLHCSSQ